MVSQASTRRGSESRGHRIQDYNFRRPSRFAKEHLRTLQSIHEQFARSLASSLSTYLRLNVRIQIDDVEQAGFEEFAARLPSPTILYLLRLTPLDGPILCELSAAPVRVMLDRLCGGPGFVATREQHLTEIERSLLRPLGRHVLRAAEDAWSTIMQATATIDDVLLNPGAARAVSPNDAVALITFELAVGDVSGRINLCLPFLTLDPIVDRLTARAWGNQERGSESDEASGRLRGQLLDVPVDLVVQLGEVDVPASSLACLAEGDIIPLSTPVRGELVARIEDHLLLRVRPGLSAGRVAVRIERTIDPNH